MTDIPVGAEPPPYESVEQGSSSLIPSFHIKVSDPVKLGEGVNSHVSYRVSTQTNLPQYRWSEFSVIRRFSDFVWLREHLAQRNRGVVIPPLPPKEGVSATKLGLSVSQQFIEDRRLNLELFLERVAAHPTLCFSTDLQFFLEASEESWAEQKQQSQPADSSAAVNPKGLAHLGKMIGDLATQVAKGGARSDRTEDPELLKVQEFYAGEEVQVADVIRQTERLIRKLNASAVATGEFGDSMSSLSQCEPQDLQAALKQVGNACHGVSKSSEVQATALTEKFDNPLKDTARQIKAVQEVLTDRQNAWKHSCNLKDEVESLDSRLTRLKALPNKESQANDLERTINDTKRKSEQASDRYQYIVDQIKVELTRHEKDHAANLRKMMCDFALTQAQLATELAKSWQDVIPDLDATAALYAKNNQNPHTDSDHASS